MISTTRRWWVGAVLAGCVAVPAMATELPDMMPADTLLYVNWPGADKLAETSKDTALNKLLAEPEIVRFRETMFPAILRLIEQKAAQEGDAAKVAAVKELLAVLWHQPVAVGLIGVGMGPAGPQVDACVVVRAGDKAKTVAEQLERLLKTDLPLDQAKEVAVGDAKLKEVILPQASIPLRWGVIGQDLVVSIGTKAAEHWGAGAEAKGLGNSERFAAAAKVTGGSAATPMLFVDLRGAIKTLEKFQPLFAPAGIPVLSEEAGIQKLLDKLGLGKLESFSAATVPQAGGFTTTTFLHAPGLGEAGGVLAAGKPLTDEDLKVVPKDASWAGVCRLDLAGVYKGLLNAVNTISPEAHGMVTGAIGGFEQKVGVSIGDDLLGAFGDTWAIYDAPSNGGLLITGITVVGQVRPDNKLDATLKTLVNAIADMAGGKEVVSLHEETHRDQKITFLNVTGIPMPIAPAWAQYKGRWILALYPQMVRVVLDRMIDAKESILDNADFQRGRKLMPAGAESLSYVDTVAGVDQAYSFVLPIGQALLAMGQKEGLAVDVSALPSARTLTKHLFGNVSASTTTKDGVVMVSHGALPVGIPAIGAGGSVATAGMMVAILLPSLARARELAKRTASAANLAGIGKALYTYSNDHKDKLPPDLETLVKEGLISEKTLISPRDCTGAKSSYTYIPQDLDGDQRNILAYEDPAIDGGDEGTNVLYLDSHVDWMSKAAFERELRETNKRLGRDTQESSVEQKERPARGGKAARAVDRSGPGAARAEIDVARAMVANGRPLATQLNLYRLHMGEFPKELKGLITKPADEEAAKKWMGPYLPDGGSLKDPWGHELQYKVPGSHNSDGYDLWSVGPDGKDGTADDITNWAGAGQGK